MRYNKYLVFILFIILYIVTVPTIYAKDRYAFLLGTNFGSGNIDTTRDVVMVEKILNKMNYTVYSSTMPTYSDIKSAFANGRKRMESNIIFLSGHGNTDNVFFNYMGQGGNFAQAINKGDVGYCTPEYTYSGLGLWKMSKVDFAFFAACNTGEGNNNIAKYAVDKGAKASLGWKVSVNDEDAYKWENYFFNYIQKGHTISQAITYANSKKYTTSGVKSVKKYGNTGSNNKLINKDINSFVVIRNDESNLSKLIELINNKYNIHTKLEDYIIEIAEPNNELVYDFYYKIGGCKSSVVYTVLIDNNGRVIDIIDNTDGMIYRDIKKSVGVKISNILSKINSKKIQKYESQAIKSVLSDDDFLNERLEIVDKYPYYDAEKDELYYIMYVKATEETFNTSSIITKKIKLS